MLPVVGAGPGCCGTGAGWMGCTGETGVTGATGSTGSRAAGSPGTFTENNFQYPGDIGSFSNVSSNISQINVYSNFQTINTGTVNQNILYMYIELTLTAATPAPFFTMVNVTGGQPFADYNSFYTDNLLMMWGSSQSQLVGTSLAGAFFPNSTDLTITVNSTAPAGAVGGGVASALNEIYITWTS